MCVSALPWMFLPIWSMAKESPPAGALSPVCVILCRAGSGLSAVTRYSMGPPGHRPAQLQLANRGEHGRGREVSQRPRRPAGPRGGWVSAAIIRPAREAPQGTTNQPTGRPPMTAARCARSSVSGSRYRTSPRTRLSRRPGSRPRASPGPAAGRARQRLIRGRRRCPSAGGCARRLGLRPATARRSVRLDHGHHHRAGRDRRGGPADRAAAGVMIDRPGSGCHRHQHHGADELDDQKEERGPRCPRAGLTKGQRTQCAR